MERWQFIIYQIAICLIDIGKKFRLICFIVHTIYKFEFDATTDIASHPKWIFIFIL